MAQTGVDDTRRWVVDVLLGSLVVASGLLTTLTREPSPGLRDPDGLSLALVLAATVPYLVRSRWPLPVFVTSTVATAALFLVGYEAGALPLVLLLGTFTVGSLRPPAEVLGALALIEVTLVVLLVADVVGFGIGDLVTSGVGFAVAGWAGWTLQSRRRRIEGFADEQAEAERRAAADERLRIAQELHDVVAHSLGVIAVQAGAALQVIDREPEEARLALEHISRTSRSSLTEIRWLLGRIRTAEGPGYGPAPGLADLDRLAGEVEGTGLAVDLRVAGGVDDVPPGAGLAAYRIVQEALTNAVRHADAHHAEVRVAVDDGVMEVDVVDDGRGGSPAPGGHGLIGMKERAAVYGGSVEAGPVPGGGFHVRARLPFGQGAS